MNERGNIALSLMIVIVALGAMMVLMTTLISMNGVSKRTGDVTADIYKQKTAIETVKYVVANGVSNHTFESFDKDTVVVGEEQTEQWQEESNNLLNEIGSTYEVKLATKDSLLVSMRCDNLYSSEDDGEEIYIGMYCSYEPFDSEFTMKVINSDTKKEIEYTLDAQGIYLYEYDEQIRVDTSFLEIKLY